MAYTPPTGSSITFSFPTGTYTPPTGNAIVFSFNVATGAAQESIVIAGQTPTLAIGQSLTPSQEAITTAGQTPTLAIGYSDTPGQGTITVEGQSTTPGQESVVIAGQTPTLAYGLVLTPTQESITTEGGIQSAPTQLFIHSYGQVPTATIGNDLTPVQATVSETMGTPTLNIGQNLSPSQAIIVEAPGTPTIEVGQSLFPAQETISVVGGNPGSIVLEGVQGSITVTGQIPTFGAEILVKTGVSGHHFNMVLIGGAGPTITIPISNFSGRLSADLTSTLTVVIPSGADYVQPILDEIAFSGGTFKIEYIDIYVDGSKEYSYSEVFDIISLRQDRGSRSYSLTVRGSATLPTNLGRKIQLTDVSYIFSQTNGKTRVRSGYNSTILPGDLAVVDEPDVSMNLAVASIYYAIGSQGITMEVSD